MPSNFCASTANSIGSSRNTSLQKPCTIIETASSVGNSALLADRKSGLRRFSKSTPHAPLATRWHSFSLRYTETCARRIYRPEAANRTACNCARLLRPLQNLHLAAVGVLPVTGRDAFFDTTVLDDVFLPMWDHLGAGIGLLIIVGQRHGVELAHGVVANAECSSDTSTSMAEPVSTCVHEILEFLPSGTCRAW